jgi:hypothetical protein
MTIKTADIAEAQTQLAELIAQAVKHAFTTDFFA